MVDKIPGLLCTKKLDSKQEQCAKHLSADLKYKFYLKIKVKLFTF